MEEGTTPFADFGALPRTDDVQREEAYGSREAAGLAPDATAAVVPVLTPELKAKLESVCTATLSSQLRKRGLNNVSIDGLTSTRPEKRIVGLARTLRYVPNREDLFKTHGGGFNAQKKAIDSVNAGEILVMEARGEKGTGTIGDILALRAQVRGAAAIITDGGVRDFSAVAAMDMPTYYANPHPAVLGRRHIPWDTDITIACGGTTVQPGDIIVADSDGILVIPPALAEELVNDCIQQEKEETFIFQMVQEGNSVDGLYPHEQGMAGTLPGVAEPARSPRVTETRPSNAASPSRRMPPSRPGSWKAPTPPVTGWSWPKSPRTSASAWSRSAKPSAGSRPRAW